MFTTVMHLTMNSAMQRPVDQAMQWHAHSSSKRRARSGNVSRTVARPPRHQPARHAILADSLKIAAGYY